MNEALSRDVTLISGSGREEDRIIDILGDEEHSVFQEIEDPKVLMFLGFDGPMIHRTMDGFPSFKGESRPIFCTPTEQNINWPLKELLRDLMEEREHFRKKEAA
jgi:hypothetical protein